MTRRPSTTATEPKRKRLTPTQWLRKLNDFGATCPCPGCGESIPLTGMQQDHINEFAISKDNSFKNFQPLCVECHDLKTNGRPHNRTGSSKHIAAKTKRLQAARLAQESGEKKAKKKHGLSKGKYKKKLNGEVVERE